MYIINIKLKNIYEIIMLQFIDVFLYRMYIIYIEISLTECVF